MGGDRQDDDTGIGDLLIFLFFAAALVVWCVEGSNGCTLSAGVR